MSKKINSSGKCLGLTSIWSKQLQHYGKSTSLLYYYSFINFSILPVFSKLQNFKTLNFFTFLIYKKNLTFFFSLVKSNSSIDFKKFFNFLSLIYYRNINILLPKKIFVCLENNSYLSNNFFKNYIFYLIIEKNYVPKKVFNLISLFLKKHINYSIITLGKNGLEQKLLKGFKIQLKGRYEATKNSMSKSLAIKKGKVNSMKLDNNIIFINHIFYTKLGLSNLKIWLYM